MGSTQEGAVVDVVVVATARKSRRLVRAAYHRALVRLTGAAGVKNEPGAWARWLEEGRRPEQGR